jgi:hypothetical protein
MTAVLQAIWRDVEAGHPMGEAYALLYDRVQLMLGDPQRYGTQVDYDEMAATTPPWSSWRSPVSTCWRARNRRIILSSGRFIGSVARFVGPAGRHAGPAR